MTGIEGHASEEASPVAGASGEAPEGAAALSPMRAQARFDAGVEAALAGGWPRARRHLRGAVAAEPDWADAWVWLAAVTENTWEVISCLTHALEADPDHALAQEGLRWAQRRLASGQAVGPMEAPFARKLAARPESTLDGTPAPEPKVEQEPSPEVASDVHWPLLPRLALAVGLVLALALAIGAVLAPDLGLGQSSETQAGPLPTPSTISDPRARFEAQWPAVQEAQRSGRWSEVIALLEEMRAMIPSDAMVRESLLNAYLQQARALVSEGLLEEALMYVDRAVVLRPHDTRVQRERQAAQLYMEGMQHHQAGDWAAATQALGRVYEIDPEYRDVRDMLYSAYLNLGRAYRAAGSLGQARKALDEALQVQPDGEEARNQYREVMVLLFPTPTPMPANDKRIEVDISEQHFYAYEGDRLAYDFVCSTGDYSSPTAPGHYKVLDKIPMAYASTWNLKMPYWLGIYWSGSLENGIHALPILSSGRILWDGYLGQRVSYGCIILSTEAAELIYNWADVGTPVIIRN